MGDSQQVPPRRSVRERKRPHHFREFSTEASDEPARKSPRIRENVNLLHTTFQSDREGMSLENIEKLIGELSTNQRDTIDKVVTANFDLKRKIDNIESKIELVSNSHQQITEKVESAKTEVIHEINTILESKIAEISSLVKETRTRLEEKINRNNHERLDSTETQNDSNSRPTAVHDSNAVPIRRSDSNLSINSVESIEQITRQISQSISTALVSHKKLIPLPKFDGNVNKWPQFKAQFERTTKRESYSTEDNVTRLEEALEGEAKALVSPMLVHHGNVPKIMERLRTRFGMPEQLAESQLAEVRRIAPIQDDQLGLVVPFADKVMNLRSFLESADCTDHLTSPTLLKELESKLPSRERITWAGYSMSLRPPTVVEFSDWLMILADQIHRIRLRDSEDKRKKARVLHVSKENVMSCSHCNGHHILSSCEMFSKEPYDRKWEIVKTNNLCFSCLRPGHRLFECTNIKVCNINECKAKHHVLLHNQVSNQLNHRAEVFQPATVLNCRAAEPVHVLFKILPVRVWGPTGSIDTFAFLDDGSSVTLINQEIADRIGASGPKGNLQLRWFGNIGSSEETTVTDVTIAGAFRKAPQYKMSGVHVVKDLKLPSQSLDINKLHPRFQSMRKLPIQPFSEVTPTILIGLDHAHLSAAKNKQRVVTDGPIVCLTKLGYVLYGPTQFEQSESHFKQIFLAQRVEEDLHEMVKKHFTTEEFGVRNCKSIESKDDSRARQLLNETTKKKEGRFESGLLWRRDEPNLPNNLSMAIRRFESCERKMMKDAVYEKAYRETMEQYFTNGYAKVLSPEEINNPKGPVWYLPHFGVMHPHKSKFRLVFDAAAAFRGRSLNSELLSGPDYNQPLIKVLALFREKRYAVCADIREMFHQIEIRDCDKDAQRFIYRPNTKQPMKICRMQVMTFGSTCSPTTAQHVKNLNAQLFAESHPEAAEAIIHKHYVDDYVDCFDSIEDAVRISRDVREIHKNAGFDLRGFISNCDQIILALSEEECKHTTRNLEAASIMNMGDKILGLTWNTSEDCFRFDLKFQKIDQEVVSATRYPSKREFLSILMSIFDPFGFLADFIIHMKIVMQKLWKSGIGWDDPIPESFHSSWNNWLIQLKHVQHFSIPRCLTNELNQATKVELHTLVDASESAFAAVCYIRVTRLDGTNEVAFIAGKTRNAPLKHLSIPRLELQAAVLGVRLSESFSELHSFRVSRKCYWSDSKTVLFWIKDERRRYRQFVANRVSEIIEASSPHDWRWVSSQDNVSDDATRYSQSPVFEPKSRWIVGPSWLKNGEWPIQPNDLQTSEIDIEVLNDNSQTTYLLHANVPFTFLLRYSDWFKLKLHTAWFLRFIKFLLQRSAVNKGGLLASELKYSETALCRVAQREMFTEEYNRLSQGKTVSRKSSIYRLTPYLDEEGVIRVMGRIDNAPTLPLFTKRPIILPKSHHVTSLIVQSYHEACAHQFEELIVAEIRRKFWIVGVKTLVKKAKKSCVPCKIFNAKPEQPMMGQIPKERLTPYIRPFSHLGVDFFGPVTVSIGRRHEKRWVALFTCLTVRAVHLELSQDLSSDSFILCLKNIMNFRGVPSVIYSDNGSNFVGTRNEIIRCEEFFDQSKIQNEVSKRGIAWKFNHPGDPSAGGCWERLVQSIKRVLKRMMKDANPKVETFRSFLIEAANIVNSRPLTHVSIESIESEPLTPNSFLIGCPNSIQTPGPTNEKLWCLRKQWRVLNSLKNHFWSKWILEYLPELTKRSKWFNPVHPLKVGDIVIVCDDDAAFRDWAKGVIVEIFKAKDNQVRGAVVKVKEKLLRRPASKLAKIEIGNSSEDEELRGPGCRLEHSPLQERSYI